MQDTDIHVQESTDELQPLVSTKSNVNNYSTLESDDQDRGADQVDGGESIDEDEIFSLDDNSATEEKVRMIISCSVPIIFTFLLSVIGTSIMMFFAGRISKDTNNVNIFAGVSLALTYCNISYLSVMEGFSSAVETLSSNYNGAKNYEAVGHTLHKSVASLSVVAVPILVTWFYVHDIFRLLGIHEDLTEIAYAFLQARMFAAPLEICMMSYMKYLQSMGIMSAGMHAGICYNAVLSCSCFLFVHMWGFSYVSIAWCHVFSVLCECILLVALTYDKKEVRRTMVLPTWESMLSVGDFLFYGFSGCVMMCAEWWAFEILTVLASMISTEALSAQTVMLQAITIFFMFPLGIGISTGAIVGNALGAGHKQLAISIGYLSLAVIFAVDLVLSPLILIFRQDFVELFTSDPEVIFTCVHQCLPILAVEIFVDGVQAVSCGVLRGAGKQNLGAAVNIGAYYCIALPVAWYLCFTEGLDVMGLMIGVCVGVISQTTVLCSFIMCKTSYVFEGLPISVIEEKIGIIHSNSDEVRSRSSSCSPLSASHKRPLSVDGCF